MCKVQEFSAAIRKYVTLNQISEDMIRNLKARLYEFRRLDAPEDLGSLRLLGFKMGQILEEAGRSHMYTTFQLTEEHKHNLKILTANFQFKEYFTYIDIVEMYEIERENIQWVNIRKVREQITDRNKRKDLKTRQQYK